MRVAAARLAFFSLRAPNRTHSYFGRLKWPGSSSSGPARPPMYRSGYTSGRAGPLRPRSRPFHLGLATEWVLLGALLLPLLAQAEPAGPTVEFFNPEGTVKKISQVTARFSESMVAFGDPRQPAPFEISCPEKGSGRWVDTKNWAFDFEHELPAGVRCEFKLVGTLKSVSGKPIGGRKAFAFSTGGPNILSSRPYEGSSSIDEDQVFILSLDSEPDESSVSSHLSFSVAGIQEKVGARVLSGSERQTVLESVYRKRGRSKKSGKQLLLVQAKQRFPAEAKVQLVWGKGSRSKTGVETTEDQILPFQVKPAFTAEFNCERENREAGCIPFSPLVVRFSGSITKDQAKGVTLTLARGRSFKPEVDTSQEDWVSSVTFKGPFPESAELKIALPPQLDDDAGRKLANADKFPLTVRTDAYPPLAKFAATFGILEAKGGAVLPLTVRNLEPDLKARLLGLGKEAGLLDRMKEYLNEISGRQAKIEKISEVVEWLKRVNHAKRDVSVFGSAEATGPAKELNIPKTLGPKAFEVVGIPIKEPGLYVVEVKSAKLGESLLNPDEKKNGAYMYVPTAVLVTNLAVHFKWGRESSLVWVTSLDSGKPVAKAAVAVRDCSGQILWQGNTDNIGVARVTGLPQKQEVPSCKTEGDYDALNYGLLVTAEQGEDMAFAHTSWVNGIEPWRFQIPTESESDLNIAHTVFDRTLLRAGETVHMKHFLRQHGTRGFSQVPEAVRPRWMVIEHQGSEQKYKFPLRWGADGIAESAWGIPKTAKLGTYEVRFTIDPEKEYSGWRSGSFRVEEFRVPLMKAVIQPPVEPAVAAARVSVDLAVSYLAGGGAARMPVKLRSQVQPSESWSFPAFEDYTFANGKVKEGRNRRESGNSYFDEDEEAADSAGEDADADARKGNKPKVQSQDLVLDNSGTARASISKLPLLSKPYRILAELQFNDPNGEVQTVSSTIPVFPSKRLVGIKLDSWAGSKDDLKFFVSVVDLSGKGVANAPVRVELLERHTYSHRKRIVGGFYAYENTEEVKKIGPLCEGRTDPRGILICQGKTQASGNLIVQAVSKDDSGNETAANREAWVAGERDWWFSLQDNDRIDVLPEKKHYEPGETAKLQVRMPFREATALVAVEREGVMEVYVRAISGKQPYLEVPVRANYAPNVYVSVLVVRGRVGDVQPTALVDLGKPAYKLGIAELNVGWRAHELKVKITADRPVYRVREKARVRIQVRTAEGKIPPPGAEVALVAVDEGLLELMPNGSWKLLDAMMGRRGYAIETSTAEMQVIGKRHFGLKALTPGGGGGADKGTRELFDTLLLWRGRVALNSNGEATADIPLGDSITSFRIVGISSAGAGLFGTGSTSIRSTQELMLFSGIPQLVRQGDKFFAQFTLRNTTAHLMDVQLSAKAIGLGGLTPIAVTLAGGEAKEVGWDILVPNQAETIQYEIEAREKGGARDRMRVTQRVVPAVPVRVFQATIAQLEKPLHLPVEMPKDALPGLGGVQVGISPSILRSLGGVTQYMKSYPYSCLEQETSRAIALQDKKLWKKLVEKLPSYLDSDGLAKYWPSMREGSDTLTAYVLAIAKEAGWEIPSDSLSRMREGLKGFVEGKVVRYGSLPTSDLAIRKIAALEALSRYGADDIVAKWLTSIALEPNLWPTSAVIDWLGFLRRVPSAANRAKRIAEAEGILRTRIHLQGTTMAFSTDTSDFLWWLMVSQDENAVRSVLTLLDERSWKDDMPRLVRGALGRQKHGHWDLTTANAWGVLAMQKFGRVFEKAAVAGMSEASLAGKSEKLNWKKSQAGRTFYFPWPNHKEEVVIGHRGPGKPWVMFQSLAAIPLQAPFWSGYRIKKEIQAVERRDSNKWSRGDIVRVRLKLESQADMTWVVVNDPIPAGSSLLGNGLGRDSTMATQDEKRSGWAWPAFEERSFEAYRAYYEWVPRGEWTAEYTLRIGNGGTFRLPATRVEAMYSPEMFGELPNATWEIQH